REQSLGTRPGENLRRELRVGLRGALAAYRARGYGGFGAERELVFQQTPHTALIHNEHHNVRTGSADLEPKASALHTHGRGRIPSTTRLAAYGVALAELRADDKTGLFHA